MDGGHRGHRRDLLLSNSAKVTHDMKDTTRSAKVLVRRRATRGAIGGVAACLLCAACGFEGGTRKGPYRSLFEEELEPALVEQRTDEDTTLERATRSNPNRETSSDTPATSLPTSDDATHQSDTTSGVPATPAASSSPTSSNPVSTNELSSTAGDTVSSEGNDDRTTQSPELTSEPLVLDTGASLVLDTTTSMFDPTVGDFADTHLDCTGAPFAAGDGSLRLDGVEVEAVVTLCEGWVAYGDNGAALRFVNLVTGEEGPNLVLPQTATELRYDAGADLLHVALPNGVSSYGLSTGSVTHIELDGAVRSIAVAETLDVWVSLSEARLLRIDGVTGDALRLLSGVPTGQLEYAPATRTLFSSSSGSVWTLSEDFWMASPSNGTYRCDNFQDAALSHDGKRLAVACGGGNGQGYNILNYEAGELPAWEGQWNTGAYPRRVAFAPDDQAVAASNGSDLQLFQSELPTPYRTLSVNCPGSSREHLTVSLDDSHAAVHVQTCDGDSLVRWLRFQPDPDLEDYDGDGVIHTLDNCKHAPNPDQENADGDAYGDACDLDATCDAAVGLVDAPLPTSWELNGVVASHDGSVVYVSVAHASATWPDSVVAVNVASERALWVMPVGQDPYRLAASSDGTRLYVGYLDASVVRAIELTERRACAEFALNPGSDETRIAGDLVVLPGTRESLLISRARRGVSPSFGGAAVYDEGVMRPTVTADWDGGSRLLVANADTYYTYDSQSSAARLYELSIDEAGVLSSELASSLLAPYGDVAYGGGYVWGHAGDIVDPQVPEKVTTIPVGFSAVTADAPSRQVAYVRDTTIAVYATDTLELVREIPHSTGPGRAFAATPVAGGGLALVPSERSLVFIPDVFGP